MRNILFIVMILFLTTGGWGCQKTEKGNDDKNQLDDSTSLVETKSAKDLAPDFTLKLTNGKDIKLSDHKGKIVIIDFWATWCPPCRRAIPDLIDIQKTYQENVVIIGISLDTETKADVIPFVKYFGINYPIAYATMEVYQAYGNVETIPTSFIVDQSGKIVDAHVGYVDKSVYTKKIDELLKKL